MINGHGDDIYRYDGLVKVNFSSNVYSGANLAPLREFMARHLDLLANYPEPEPRSLEQLIARHEGISPEGVMVTNGATEAIYLIAQHYSGSVSIIPQPTFSEYADACRIYRHIISYETGEDLRDLPRDRVYWICNPNNPSGNVLMKGFVNYVVRRSPRYTFVVDQSYEAYTREPLLRASEMQDVTNLLLLHSLSKTYGVPGLRLGYITGHPSTIQLLRAKRHPWALGSLAIEAGKFLLTHGTPLTSLTSGQSVAMQSLTAYLQETERLRTALRHIPGVRVFETKTNYMLCQLDTATAADLKHYLVHQHGMLIRDCSNFYGLTPHFFRVATQQPEQNDALVAAIAQFLQRK